MLLDIIAYAIIAITAGLVIYSLFFKKDKSCGCGEKSCTGCPYCNSCKDPRRGE